MAVDFLEEIYQYANLISELRRVVYYIRTDDDHHAVMNLNAYFPQICTLCKKAVETNFEQAGLLWEQVKVFRAETTDLSWIGDVLEKEVVPRMELWVQSLGKIEQEVDDTYVLESSDSGFLTMRSETTHMYIHSKNDPMDAARQYVATRYDAGKKAYSVFGCGMGYHIYQLYIESGGSVPIEVYEPDPRVVQYAMDYGVLDWIPCDRIKVVTRDCVMKFLKSVEDGTSGMLIYMPSVKQMQNELEREVVTGLCIPMKTINALGKDMVINSWRNIQKELKEASEQKGRLNMDEVVVVAAGPSLDDAMDTLRVWQGQKRIVCVGTVFKKLLAAGIRPDYVVVSDPQERTLKQIADVESETIPMIIGMTAHWGFAERYQGDKYIVYTGIHDIVVANQVQELAKEIWSSGSTVTYLALESALRLGAKAVYFVGVDLAFPGGITHATDTLDRTTKKTDNLLEVCGVGGVPVYSNGLFSMYREEMESRIAEAVGVKFYNLSRVGARIKGTVEIRDTKTL